MRKANSAHQSSQPKKKFKGNCFNCGKTVHRAAYYKAPKKTKNKDQANVVEFEDDDICVMLSKCNIGGNLREW